MAEVEISYKGSNIATMNASGTKTLLTEAKYLEDDVTITYARPSAPSGTKNISITANGVTTEDVTNYASAQITASVPNTYAAADEGKVVDDGALVAQGSQTITTNGTYDTTLISELIANISGGGNLEYNMGTITFTSDTSPTSGVQVAHGLSAAPEIVLFWCEDWTTENPPDYTTTTIVGWGLIKYPNILQRISSSANTNKGMQFKMTISSGASIVAVATPSSASYFQDIPGSVNFTYRRTANGDWYRSGVTYHWLAARRKTTT